MPNSFSTDRSLVSAIARCSAQLQSQGLQPRGVFLTPDDLEDFTIGYGTGFIFGLQIAVIANPEERGVWAYDREPKRLEIAGRVWLPLDAEPEPQTAH